MRPTGVSKFLALGTNMCVNHVLAGAVLNQLDCGHEISVGTNEDRDIKQVVDCCLDQIRNKCRIHAFLDGALKCITTTGAFEYVTSTCRVGTAVRPTCLSFLDGDAVSGEPLHRMQEPTQPRICGTAEVD